MGITLRLPLETRQAEGGKTRRDDDQMRKSAGILKKGRGIAQKHRVASPDFRELQKAH
jgi:hypothetical protein